MGLKQIGKKRTGDGKVAGDGNLAVVGDDESISHNVDGTGAAGLDKEGSVTGFNKIVFDDGFADNKATSDEGIAELSITVDHKLSADNKIVGERQTASDGGRVIGNVG